MSEKKIILLELILFLTIAGLQMLILNYLFRFFRKVQIHFIVRLFLYLTVYLIFLSLYVEIAKK